MRSESDNSTTNTAVRIIFLVFSKSNEINKEWEPNLICNAEPASLPHQFKGLLEIVLRVLDSSAHSLCTCIMTHLCDWLQTRQPLCYIIAWIGSPKKAAIRLGTLVANVSLSCEMYWSFAMQWPAGWSKDERRIQQREWFSHDDALQGQGYKMLTIANKV